MDRRERWAEPVEALRAALDGRQAEMWTALPGIVQSFDPAAMTVSVQPAVAGRISDEAGKAASVDLPILPDVPVVFPGGGGFALTFPVAAGDECLVVFASRCIDAWWQSGGVGEPMEPSSVTVRSGGSITLDAPRIVIKGLLSMQSQGGGATTATLAGSLNATGDVTASNISLNSHTHPGDSGGTTGGPQ